jgi:hypothetical protein
MALGMTELSYLSLEDQEEILSKLSSDGPCPIEIDEQIYYIPSAVNQLIENLYRQACDFQKGENGTPQNKE